MDISKVVLWALVIILCVLYLVILPVARRKSMQKQSDNFDKMHQSIKNGDTVILNDGIKGSVQGVRGDELQILIASNTVITVKSMGVIAVDHHDKEAKNSEDQ